MPHHVSKAEFATLVEAALAELPQQFAEALDEIAIEIRTRPTRSELRRAGLKEDQLLLGLYQGIALTERSVEHSGTLPALIYIFQEDIEQVSHGRRDLIDQVRTTVLHEIGHHFGMSEEDLDQLGYG